jgi:multicomponent Na+:H+ antiporter subunit G
MNALDYIGGALLLSGTLICIIGGIGLLRMPDFFTRAHAASVPDTLGAGLALTGMICLTIAGSWGGGGHDAGYLALIVFKLVSIAVLILVTSPIAGHAVAKAALERGMGGDEASGLKRGEICPAELAGAGEEA